MLGYKLAMYHNGTWWRPCMVTLEIPNDAVIVRKEFVDKTEKEIQEQIATLKKTRAELSVVKTYSKKLRCDKAKVLDIVDFKDANVQITRAVSIFALGLIIDGWHDGVHHIQDYLGSYRPCDILDYACNIPGAVYMPLCVVKPTGLDTDVTEECGEGIHFFLSEEDAREYFSEGRSVAGSCCSWPIAVMSHANIRTRH